MNPPQKPKVPLQNTTRVHADEGWSRRELTIAQYPTVAAARIPPCSCKHLPPLFAYTSEKPVQLRANSIERKHLGRKESIAAAGSVLNVPLGHVSPQTGGADGGGGGAERPPGWHTNSNSAELAQSLTQLTPLIFAKRRYKLL